MVPDGSFIYFSCPDLIQRVTVLGLELVYIAANFRLSHSGTIIEDALVDTWSFGGIVGGESLQIDRTALMLAGLQSSAIWMLPVLAGAVGTTAFYLKTRKN